VRVGRGLSPHVSGAPGVRAIEPLALP
jgi:hypothetical protein